MKEARHAKIKDILEKSIILTQKELTEVLLKHGFKVTQATVSRDIKELMLVKTPLGDGQYRYTFVSEQNNLLQYQVERIFQDYLINVDSSANMIVLKTLPGMAQAVAYNVDALKWPEILGTVAGDDTIFILLKSANAAPMIVNNFQKLMEK